MPIQQSDIAVKYVNQIIGLVQQIANLQPNVSALMAVNTVNPLGNLINELNTAALNTDGSLGTADAAVNPAPGASTGTSVSGHYLDSRQYPALSRVVKNTDIINALQVLNEFQTFTTGLVTPADGARPAFINAVAM